MQPFTEHTPESIELAKKTARKQAILKALAAVFVFFCVLGKTHSYLMAGIAAVVTHISITLALSDPTEP